MNVIALKTVRRADGQGVLYAGESARIYGGDFVQASWDHGRRETSMAGDCPREWFSAENPKP